MGTIQNDIERLTAGITGGETNAVAIAESCINAAERFNDTLNAFLEIDRRGALKRAEEVDESLAGADKKTEVPVLAGVPVAVKDNIHVRGMQSSCGSKILGDYHPPYNATVIDRLLSAGAVP